MALLELTQWAVTEVVLDTSDHMVLITVVIPEGCADLDSLNKLKSLFAHLRVTGQNAQHLPLYTIWLQPSREYWRMMRKQFETDPEFMERLQRNINEKMK